MSDPLKAFIKIPGGKRKSIPYLVKNLPKNYFKEDYTYVEPFLGGGSFGLHLLNIKLEQNKLDIGKINKSNGEQDPKIAFKVKKLIQDNFLFNEKNPDIFNLWMHTMYDAPELLEYYMDLLSKHSEKEFYTKRGIFNTIKDPKPLMNGNCFNYLYNTILKSALFLYLDKHCFNGLIRYNKNGDFNSPCGKYRTVQKVDGRNMLNLYTLTQASDLTLENLDFQEYIEYLFEEKLITNNKKILVYFDPPYVPLTPTSNFTEYNPAGFGQYDQIRLKSMIDYLTSINVKIMLSNSSARWVYDTYKDYNIQEVAVARSINSVGAGRGKIKELLITNY